MRHTFGGDLASYTIALGPTQTETTAGVDGYPAVVVGGQVVTFWDSQNGGTQYIDLLEATTGGPDDQGGSAITSVTTSSGTDGEMPLGCIPLLLGPDGIAVMWAQVGDGDGGAVSTPSDSGDPTNDDTGDDTGDDTDDMGGDGEVTTTTDDDSDTGDDTVEGTGDASTDPDPLDPDDDTEDTTTGVDAQGTSGDNLRLMIIASTAGLQVQAELDEFRTDIENRVEVLEQFQHDTETHLQLHDDEITELQNRSSGGGGGGGLITGHTNERGTATLGAQFLDIDTNRIWTGINRPDGSGPVWAPPPGTAVFKARQTTAQNINDGESPTLALQAIDYDLLGGWKSSTPTRYIPTVPGFYLLQAVVGFSANTQAAVGSFRYITWKLNGTSITAGTTAYPGGQTWSLAANARSISVYCNGVSDRIELVIYTNAGITMTTMVTSWGQTQMNITYQGGSGGE